MLRSLIVVLVAVAAGNAAYAQSTPHARNKQKAAPAAQATEDPNDIAAVPRNVQKWVGGAVDDILSGADLGGGKR